MKKCTKCSIEKETYEFHKQSKQKDGLHSWCKDCHNKFIRESRQSIEYKEYQKQYNKNYVNSIIYKKNLKKYKDNRKSYDRIRMQSLEYKLYQKEYTKKYRKTKQRKLYKKLYQKQNSIMLSLRNRINKVIKNNVKSKHTIELLGCSIKQLKQHLESQFKSGMSWNNHGTGHHGKGMQEWHIDHIKPCASFDLSKAEEQLKCFHYTNLQPLWANENLTKADKYDQGKS